MKTRMNYFATEPKLMGSVMTLENAIKTSGLDHRIIHLVKLRASQINGCAYCVDMHVKEGRRDGESEQRLHLVSAWRESPLFTERERAALAWTESLTHLSQTGAPDADYEPLKAHFSDDEIVKLTLVIGMINLWNRVAVGFRSQHPIDQADKAAA